MGLCTRRALAALGIACATSCSLVAPLDGLTHGTPPSPDAADDAADAATEVTGQDAPADALGEAAPPSYASTVLADAPLAYWRLGETSGTVCHDATGNGNDATLAGNVVLGAPGAIHGDADTAAHFDGVFSSVIDVGDRFDFPGTAPLSIELWARPDVIDGTYRQLEGKMQYGDAGRPYDGTYIFVHAGTTLGYERWANGTTDLGMSSQLVMAGSYWHIVATYDGAIARLFVNGALDQTAPTAMVLTANGVHLGLGRFFQGALDEVAIYDHALSPERVKAHYMAGTQ